MLLHNASLSDSEKDVSQVLSATDDHFTEEKAEQQECSRALHILDCAPAPGWTAHVSNDGRLYYCNHITRTAGWLPPAESWKSSKEALPYGWERAIDDSGRSYYINHVNKTTTYETPAYKNIQNLPKPEPRIVTLERSTSLGFGFVAGSEKPVIVRFVTEGGPSVDKLLPGDHILSVNGEDVKTAPREHVISLVRSCTKSVTLQVCQPAEQQGVRKSTLLSATKRARLKCKPSRVRFAESVCVNGAPLFPQSAFTLGDFCVPPMANVLKVFLENGQTKSFKYDTWTTVQNVINSLQTKLCIRAAEHFSLVVEHIKSLKRNKLTLLDSQDSIARIASQPGAHKLRCLFRVTFVPVTAAKLAQQDLNALDYLYNQCCNDVIQERFSPELQCDTALKLAALHICQHALANNIPTSKLTIKVVERQFGIERFIPTSILESLKRKEIRKVIGHFLKLHSNMAGPGKQLTALQLKLHYLDIVSQLPSYGAKCFSTGPKGDAVESVILVSPKFGISQITGHRNSVFQPIPIANLEDMKLLEVKIKDETTRIVIVTLQNERTLRISLEEKDALELVLVFRGYFKLMTGQELPVDQEILPNNEDVAPSYLTEHKVVPEKWSYIEQSAIKTVSFGISPRYQSVNKKTNGLYNTVGRHSKPTLLIDYSFDSNMNSSLSNRNYQYFNINNMEMTNVNGFSGKVLKRMHETHLKNFPEQYSIEEQNFNTLQSLSEWQETSVDVESDSDEPGKLKHSDSLTLLNKIHKDENSSVSKLALDLLKQETLQPESDNDSLYTPHNSPDLKKEENELNLRNRVSFGLKSPNTSVNEHRNFQEFLQHIYDLGNTETNTFNSINNIFVFDTDIIDLTSIPPPMTPDKLDSTLPTPINVPPISFADSMDKLNALDSNDNQELEEFLARVSVPPPTQKVTPAMELTPEEIMAYIIPPPPSKDNKEANTEESPFCSQNNPNKTDTILELSNLIEKDLVTNKIRNFELKSGDSKAQKIVFEKAIDDNGCKPVLPLPRRSVYQRPPERPPKEFIKDRKRSHSVEQLKLHNGIDLQVPKLPPRINSNLQGPRLSLPPKKLELVSSETEHCLKSEELISYNKTSDLQEHNIPLNVENSLNDFQEQRILKECSTAVATPTSSYIDWCSFRHSNEKNLDQCSFHHSNKRKNTLIGAAFTILKEKKSHTQSRSVQRGLT